MSINTIRLILILLVVLGLFSLFGLTLFFPIKDFQIEIVDTLIGALLAAFAGIMVHYFRD